MWRYLLALSLVCACGGDEEAEGDGLVIRLHGVQIEVEGALGST